MDFLDTEIQRYSDAHCSPEGELLHRIERETHLEVMRPRMLSGPMQGRVLSMFSAMIKPQCILEIGTFTGYSALCLAEGLAEGGRLITMDIDEELEDRVRGYFSESKYGDQIDYRIGKGLDIIPQLEESFDLVFIDADKVNYRQYYELLIPKMNKGGIIIADNVLWSGKVVEEVKDNDLATKALLDFNDFVQKDDRVENVLMPLRDGLMIARVL
ncbi:O-methyltransferase [Reichenbachiella ulvae]|uniref:O-methyltransferase n=1 Tax=Reichenbachiella ulvae TaxID=2980104 RepID=A0ABT3CRN2_9BACT|nr:O-methyltransferase [Reichenbachiella ulvae]MCV9386272.1 O-methyltransferase [Reichenbachiella ulvae]